MMLERQYERVIRWVRRAQSMSDHGNYSDAILDVECARAELEGARQELLLCHSVGARPLSAPVFWRALPAALCALLVLALPLGTGSDQRPTVAQEPVAVPQIAVASSKPQDNAEGRFNEWLTADEKQLLDAVRKGMDEPVQAARRAAPTELHEKADSPKGPVVVAQRPESDELSAEEMFRLMEVGRKALRKKSDSLVLELN